MALRNAFASLGLDDTLRAILYKLQIMIDRLPLNSGGNMPVFINGTPNVAVTNSPTVTVASISNVGGKPADADQYVQMQLPAQDLRSRITVT
jgi:hypothetical protein